MIFKMATHIAAISEDSLKDAALCLSEPLEKFKALYLSCPEKEAPSYRTNQDTAKDPRLICPGRLVRSKGQEVLIRAAAVLSKKYKNLKIEFAGGGPLRKELELLVKKLGLSEVCLFTGMIGHEETIQKIASAIATVVPSLADAMPLVMAESFSVGTPVVGSNVHGMPEAITDGLNGFLFPPGNADNLAQKIDTLLSNPDLQTRMKSESLRIFRERFSQKALIPGQADWLENIFVPAQYALVTALTTNLGDDIQSLAAAQFLPKIDFYIDRDHMSHSKSKGNLSLILNGWFMHPALGYSPSGGSWLKRGQRLLTRIRGKELDWPPPSNFHPLFLSFHGGKELLFSRRFKNYYKKFEPIGCRDYYTVERFKKNGINAYFSGCLTLTFPRYAGKREETIYFVDPLGPSDGYKFPKPGEPGFKTELWNCFPEEIRQTSVYLSHECHSKDAQARLALARKLLALYARAKLVVTSRLHCALPCLAMETPVIFLYNDFEEKRFRGLVDLLRKYSFSDIQNGRFDINWKHPEPNPFDVSDLAAGLAQKCRAFYPG